MDRDLPSVADATLSDWTAGTEYNGARVDTAGDMDGDGRGDLLVISPSTAWVFPASGLAPGALDLGDGLRIDPTASWTYSDWAFLDAARSAGDLDGDGLGDLLLGCERCGEMPNPGAVWILLGDSFAGWGVSVTELDADAEIHADELAPRIGRATVAGADFDGDGLDDWGTSSWVGSEGGGTLLFYGFAPGVARTPSDADLYIRTPPEEDYVFSGEYLSAGDFDGDGRHDLAVSNAHWEVWRHQVYRNAQLRPGTLEETDAQWSFESDDDYLVGGTTMGGDIDGDGSSDLLIGQPFYPGPRYAGRALAVAGREN